MDIGRARATREHIDNLEFVLGRAEDVQLPYIVDAITSSYLAKYANLPRLAQTMHIHYGSAQLRYYPDNKQLSGDYFTSKERVTHGRLSFNYSGSKLLGRFAK